MNVSILKSLIKDYEAIVMDLEIQSDCVFHDRRIMITEAEEFVRILSLKEVA